MTIRIAAILLALSTSLAGCAGSAWRQALDEDSIDAYHSFLKEYPDTTFSDEARARLDLARIRKRPTRAAFEAFRARHDDPALLAELRPHLEETFFRHARSLGTLEAYREFLDQYPSGRFSARARGNLAYLERGGFAGDVAALAEFAARNPDSDFAPEAERSVSAVALRGRSSFRRIGLRVEVDPTTPGADRLRRVFLERAAAAYTAAGLEVVPLANSPSALAEAGRLAAVLRILHQEHATTTKLELGQVSEAGILATTQVTLQRAGDAGPIWSDTFEYRAPLSARRDDVSILFGPGSHSTYWAELDGEFFVPIARWSTQITAREPVGFSKPAVAVEMSGTRAVVLFGDGDFELFDLGDPALPVRLGEYRRPRDLSSFDGVTLEASRVALFGADGVEIVRIDGEKTVRELALGRDVVGSVRNVEWVGGAWLAATNRGLLQLGDGAAAPQTLVDREILGMARAGERVLFTDGVSLYLATPAQLGAGRIAAEVRLGRGFHPQRVRVHGNTAVVLGERDAVWVELGAGQLQLRSRIGGTESGRVSDAAVIADRLFLLGPRGLQVADRRGERIVDSVDVLPRERIDVSGRHLVLIGDRSLQVVDATPFVAPQAAADAANPR